MSICPLCNGLIKLQQKCLNCSNLLRDQGTLESYFDPYSPYLDENILDMVDGVVSEDYCIHLLTCSFCNSTNRKAVSKIDL